MKIRTVVVACLGIALFGCATFGQMEAGLNALLGKPERTAFQVLGYPSTQQEFLGDKVYSWYVNSSGTIFIPQTDTTRGRVGNTSFTANTTYNQAVPINHNCMIKIAAGSDGLIKNYEYSGNIGGCKGYISRLKEYSNSVGEPVYVSSSDPPSKMACAVDADCSTGESCRSKKGGGTECRAVSKQSTEGTR